MNVISPRMPKMQTAVRRTAIYGLLDPETKEIRYVGRTEGSLRRCRERILAAAADGGATRLHCWCRRVTHKGLEPDIILLQVLPGGSDLTEAEAYWIHYWRGLGARLYN